MNLPWICTALVAGLTCFGASAQAQGTTQGKLGDFPNRPIRLITLTTAGGSLDTVARTIARYLPDEIGGPQVVVENRVGAGGNIGADAVAKAAPDGYTIGMVTISTHGINPTLYGDKMPFDAVKDFAPIAPAVANNNIIAVHPSIPAKNIPEFVAYLKANPDKVSFGSAGTGTSQHLAGELFKVMTGTHMTHVPYKGAAQAVPDLLTGVIQVMITSALETGEHIKSGALCGLAVTGKTRLANFPDLAPVAEQGYPDFDVVTWFGVVAPAGTPPVIVQRYNTAIRKILATEEVKERLAALGFDTVTDKSPEQFAEFIKSEIAKWAPIVQASGAKIN
jgi:tripartite-type tricarboxylate transporter receptor subunit TctC